MKNKYLFFIAIVFISNTLSSQTIVDTESSLKTGNFDLSFLRADLTIGSRVKNDLFRLTFSHSSTKFNGNNFDKSTNLQFRWNKI